MSPLEPKPFDSAREFLASLPPSCIGPERLLSRALYRLSYDNTQTETVGSVYQLAGRYGRDATLGHLLLLPDAAYRWIIGGFMLALQDQVFTSSDDLHLFVMFVASDEQSETGLRGGHGHKLLAPKSWAQTFLQDALRQRPTALQMR